MPLRLPHQVGQKIDTGVPHFQPAELITTRHLAGKRQGRIGDLGVVIPITPATVSYADSAVSTGATTFSTMGLGTAAANRHVVTCVGNGGGVPAQVTALTVDGVSATQLVERDGVIDGRHTYSIWISANPSNTSGDVVLTVTDSDPRIGVNTFAVYGADPAASDTASDLYSATLDLTISCPAGGVIIGGAFAGNDSATWSNITERNDETIAAAYKHSCASDAFDAVQTNLAVTAAHASADCVGCAISLGPA